MLPCLRRRKAVVAVPIAAATIAALLLALGPAATALASSAEGGHARYLVRRGDTLSEIALAHHTTVAALTQQNAIGDPGLIYAGTWLVLPSAPHAPQTGAASATHYVVRRGDNLSSIALRFGLSAQALAAANGISDPDLILAGAALTIPGTSTSGSSAGTASPTANRLPASLRAHPERLQLTTVFDHWAGVYGLPADLLKALAWMESGWQAGVVSPVGAIGVTQLMPATARFVSKDLLGVTLNPWNASDNIRMGARYLRYLLDLAGGDVSTAVASYYQGFASVRVHGRYSDTVAYVQGILAQRSWFR